MKSHSSVSKVKTTSQRVTSAVDSPVSRVPKHTHRVQSIHPPDEAITEEPLTGVPLPRCTTHPHPPLRRPNSGMHD